MDISPDSPPGVQTAKKTVIEPTGLIAKSMADQFAENPKPEAAAAEAKPDFAKLTAAQAKDKGKVSSEAEPAAEKPKPAEVAAKEPPKIPALPPAEEYRPRTEKAAQQWDSLKAKHAEVETALKSELDHLKAELAAAKANGSPDVAAIKKEAAELREILRDVAIERHPEFKQKFEPREKTAIEAAKLAAGDQGNKLEKLLKSPPGLWRDEQIEAITAELPKSSQIRVESAIRMLDQIDLEKQSEIASQRASFDLKQSSLMDQQKTQIEQARQKVISAFDTVHKQWSDPASGHPFYVEREGDKEHNAAVKESSELAKATLESILNGQINPEDLAKVVHWMAVAPLTLNGWQQENALRTKAERALDRLRGVQPGEGKPGQVNGSDADKAPAPGSPEYLRYMNAQLRAAQQKDSGRG